MDDRTSPLAAAPPTPRRDAKVSSCTAMAFGLLAGCGSTNIELLIPRSDASSPVASPTPDAGPDPDKPAEPPPVEDDAGAPPATQDAGPQDAGPQDAGNSACPGDPLLCEGFESNLAGWTFVRSDGTATATMLDSHSGMGSLELATTKSAGAFAYLERRLTPVSSGSLYLRAFLKVPADQPVNNYDFLVLSNAASDAGVAVSFGGTTLSLSNLSGGATASGALAFPRGSWVCLEVALSLSAASNATTDLDGKRDATLVTGGVPAGGYARVAIGVVRASPTQMPTRILIDDLVIAPTPIGCK